MEQQRLEYNLDENSVVFDVGGYRGDWANKIYKKYQCYVYIFEPVKIFYDLIKIKFEGNNKIKVYNIALGNESKECVIYKQADRTSLHIKNENTETIHMLSFSDFIKQNPVERINVMKINIEGEEYNLLNNIIDNELHTNIANIQIQFHATVSEYILKREKIIDEFSKTHKRTFNYDMVWENWEIK